MSELSSDPLTSDPISEAGVLRCASTRYTTTEVEGLANVLALEAGRQGLVFFLSGSSSTKQDCELF